VRNHGERLAVQSTTEKLTYGQLNCLSNRVAHEVLSKRGPGSEPVALMLRQGASLIAAILGVLKAGKMYVPLDASHPPERLRRELSDSGSALLLTDRTTLRSASQFADQQQQILNVDSEDICPATDNPHVDLCTDALAYLFYTSGSTGQPKGVMDNHRNVLHNIMRYTNSLGIGWKDHLTLLQSSSFSGSVSNPFCALLNGATVHSFDLRQEGLDLLADRLMEEGITMFHSVPAIFQHLMSGPGRFPSLRVIRLEGDVTLPHHVELFQQGHRFSPDCMLVNGLGATETGLTRQYVIDAQTVLPGHTVPIGHPTDDMEIVLLDDAERQLPPNEIGEIVVRSRYLAVGYCQNEQLTDARFRSTTMEGERAYSTTQKSLSIH